MILSNPNLPFVNLFNCKDVSGHDCHWSLLLKIMAWSQNGAKPLSEQIRTNHQLEIKEFISCYILSTHWGWDKMAAISKMILSNAFSWTNMSEFRLRFHWSLFLRFELTIFQHWFRKRLGTDKATSHYLNQWWLNYWRICVTRPQWVNAMGVALSTSAWKPHPILLYCTSFTW